MGAPSVLPKIGEVEWKVFINKLWTSDNAYVSE